MYPREVVKGENILPPLWKSSGSKADRERQKLTAWRILGRWGSRRWHQKTVPTQNRAALAACVSLGTLESVGCFQLPKEDLTH